MASGTKPIVPDGIKMGIGASCFSRGKPKQGEERRNAPGAIGTGTEQVETGAEQTAGEHLGPKQSKLPGKHPKQSKLRI